MKPTEILSSEHRIIEKILFVAKKEVEKIKNGSEVNINRIEKILDFVRNFADKCHHGKEENNLFKKLEEKGMTAEGGPIGVMMYEHTLGRELIKNTADSLKLYAGGDKSAAEGVAENLAGYADLLSRHIFKEDNILFKMADNFLNDDDNNSLLAAFDYVEKVEMGNGFHEKYSMLADELINSDE
jgi:hemerythrin-like domain-containing protein